MAARLRVVHVSPGVLGRGGIETLHTYHRELPFDQHFIAFFDRDPVENNKVERVASPAKLAERSRVPNALVTALGTTRSTSDRLEKVERLVPKALTATNYTNLNFTWRTPIFEMRRRFRAALAPHKDAVVIYHNGWGLPLWLDLDGAARRLVFFHADPAYHAPDCPGFRGHLDGAGGITPALHDLWKTYLPELTPNRTRILRTPINPPGSQFPVPSSPRRISASAEIRLGYAGRIEKAQKRLDRLPAFLDALAAAGVTYRFELLGDGSYRPELESLLRSRSPFPAPGSPPVHFHGWVTKADYWNAISKWDGVVFFSDHEGGPIGLMEGMAVGAIPFYPASLGSWGDFYTPQVDPILYYKPGDMTALAAAVKDIFSRPPDEIARLREKSAALMRPHTPDEFKRACTDLITAVASLPRISRVPPLRRPRFSDLLPLGLVTRVFPDLLRVWTPPTEHTDHTDKREPACVGRPHCWLPPSLEKP